MKAIQELVDYIDEELECAKNYAEKALEYKAHGNSSFYNKYKEMANDELRHADMLHDQVSKETETYSNVFMAPVEMQEKWDIEHKKYIEDAAWIKTMLQM